MLMLFAEVFEFAKKEGLLILMLLMFVRHLRCRVFIFRDKRASQKGNCLSGDAKRLVK